MPNQHDSMTEKRVKFALFMSAILLTFVWFVGCIGGDQAKAGQTDDATLNLAQNETTNELESAENQVPPDDASANSSGQDQAQEQTQAQTQDQAQTQTQTQDQAQTQTQGDSAPFRIGIVTATDHQGIDVNWAMQKIFERYKSVEQGGIIKHVTYPDNFMSELEKTMAVIEDLAQDSLIKVIYVIEGVPGTAEAFLNIRSKRPDILLLVSESHEDPGIISEVADLVVSTDFEARGYLIPYVAKTLGAKSFVHVSFPRHMIDESFNRRRTIMELACQDLGLQFGYENAPDPTADGGIEVAQNFILEHIPLWLEEYGPDTAFFTTNNAHTAPMIRQIVEHGGYFVEADEASPLFAYPEALGLEIDADIVEWKEIIDLIEKVLVDKGAGGRLGTWTSSLTYSHIWSMVEFGYLAASGQKDKSDTKALLECYEQTAPGVKWNGSYYIDQNNKEYSNIFLIYQDTYIFGLGYVETTKVDIPEKYKSVSLDSESDAQN
ncbi:MAG: DUF3798 domain-containing protein [Deltaproteobacteria bacterium]|jgi:hypothetical protein|nr:DUF3798 domain-containing protein [Deltaproteobacteria bacterium]